VSNCCSHGDLLHFGLQSPQLNLRYCNQDRHHRPLRLCSRDLGASSRAVCPPTRRLAFPLVCDSTNRGNTPWALVRPDAATASIFDARGLGRCVVTRSLADADFHGHRPAVFAHGQSLRDFSAGVLAAWGVFAVHPASPALFTSDGPLAPLRLVSRFPSPGHLHAKQGASFQRRPSCPLAV